MKRRRRTQAVQVAGAILFTAASSVAVVDGWIFLTPKALPARPSAHLRGRSISEGTKRSTVPWINVRETRQKGILSLASSPATSSSRERGKTDADDLNSTATAKNTAIQSFLDHFQVCIASNNLHSLTLRGLSKKSAKDQPEARGSLSMLVGRPIVLGGNNKNATTKQLLQVTFKYHSATDIAKNWEMNDCCSNLESILLNKQDNGENVVPASEWDSSSDDDNYNNKPCRIQQIQSASLQTLDGMEWELQQLNSQKPKLSKRRIHNQQQPAPQSHDRVKHAGPIAVDAPLWQALGVTNANSGKLRPGMSSKFKQCQKFVEIVERLVASVDRNHGNVHSQQALSMVDMGCGRGYATFALHAALSERYRNVRSRGIDVRPKLVREISDIAVQLEMNETLRFETGTIESFLAEQDDNTDDTTTTTTNILIALHACDTATDDALWSGIRSNATILVVAPCCHQQVRPQLNRHVAAAAASDRYSIPHPYTDVLRHNIYRERVAETVTDSLRALLLEYAGYKVQVFEFIGGEHTSKNVMITAVKQKQQQSNTAKLLERIRSLAALHGIHEQKLAAWMEVELSWEEDGFKKISARSMPPLRS